MKKILVGIVLSSGLFANEFNYSQDYNLVTVNKSYSLHWNQLRDRLTPANSQYGTNLLAENPELPQLKNFKGFDYIIEEQGKLIRRENGNLTEREFQNFEETNGEIDFDSNIEDSEYFFDSNISNITINGVDRVYNVEGQEVKAYFNNYKQLINIREIRTPSFERLESDIVVSYSGLVGCAENQILKMQEILKKPGAFKTNELRKNLEEKITETGMINVKVNVIGSSEVDTENRNITEVRIDRSRNQMHVSAIFNPEDSNCIMANEELIKTVINRRN